MSELREPVVGMWLVVSTGQNGWYRWVGYRWLIPWTEDGLAWFGLEL